MGASIGMCVLLFILPVVAILIKIDSRGPVFFFQNRVGRFGKRIRFIKFRTMIVDAHLKQSQLDEFNETRGITFKMRNDPRLTRIGKLLRKSSIDEMPQFWVVLKGDMSLVGPRPPLLSEVSRYNSIQKIRLTVPQGITGLWQVRGRSKLQFEEMVDLDNYYAVHANLLLDIKIILYTIPSVLFGRGAV